MRFPYQADLTIIPVSPISDGDRIRENPAFDTIYSVGCFASTTSGTFDPDIQFNGQALATGAFGQLVDIWISNRRHRELVDTIGETGITFSAPLQLRLNNILILLAGGKTKQSLLFDPTSTVKTERFPLGRGFGLTATRVYPTLTALTFDVARVGV